MMDSTSVCPVPAEQQPLNEYQDLRGSWFYGWAARSWLNYLKPFFVLWLLSWAVVGPVAAVSFPLARSPVHFVLSASAGAFLLPTFALTRLYLGWLYVRDRLYKDMVSYEESGWYDGQTWMKPPEVVQRDRLIVSYEIKPILKRLQQTFGVMMLFLLGEMIVWGVV
jgi:hypothetical protein